MNITERPAIDTLTGLIDRSLERMAYPGRDNQMISWDEGFATGACLFAVCRYQINQETHDLLTEMIRAHSSFYRTLT